MHHSLLSTIGAAGILGESRVTFTLRLDCAGKGSEEMDGFRIDRLARLASSPAGRRSTLRALLGLALFGPASAGGDVDAKRRGANADVSAARRRRKRKKKGSPACVPNCDRKVCGADGCGGTCGDCASPTNCDGQGRCVGCQSAGECAAIPCQQAACSGGVCQYSAGGEGGSCGNGRTCCRGICTDTRSDAGHCGRCGQNCSFAETCVAGECIIGCDVCDDRCFFASVQAAVDAAPPGSTVRICPGFYIGLVVVGKNLTLLGLGEGPSATVLSSTTVAGPVVKIEAGAQVTVRNVRVVQGRAGCGGGILNEGTLRLEEVIVEDNRAADTFGGAGICNFGTMTVVDSIVRDNIAESTAVGGGGIFNSGIAAELIRSRVEGNRGLGGGGIWNQGLSMILRDGTVVTGNTADGINGQFGGGVYNGTLLVVDDSSRISGNTPDDCVNVSDGTGCPA
jgi:hypothetical protein